jgi:hypothetical protein
MYEAGDGRVTRSSVLAAHSPAADTTAPGGGIPEATRTYFGAADHHGLYADPAFQSLILRLVLGPPGPPGKGLPASRRAPGPPK